MSETKSYVVWTRFPSRTVALLDAIASVKGVQRVEVIRQIVDRHAPKLLEESKDHAARIEHQLNNLKNPNEKHQAHRGL